MGERRLTYGQRLVLQMALAGGAEGAEKRDVGGRYWPNFDQLSARGFLSAPHFGAYLITEAGRQALASQEKASV